MKSIAKRLPAFLFAAVLVFSLCTAYRISYTILDSDASSEMVLGRLLAEQHTLVTADWIYSSEIRLFGTNLIYMPLFSLLTDWHVIRFLSIAVMQLMLTGSYYYLSRRMKMSLNAYFLSASLLLVPIGVVYGRIVLYHNYYIPCIVYGFLIVGLYLSALERRGKRGQALRIAALLLLSLLSCMNGFRQLLAAMVPLLFAALIAALRQGGSLALIPRRSRQAVWLAGAVCAAGAVGLLLHNLVLSRYFQFRSMTGSTVSLPAADNFRQIAVGYLSLFGFQEGRPLFSLAGMLALGSVAAGLILLFVSLRPLLRRGQEADMPVLLAETFYPVAMLCMTFAFLVLSGYDNYPQYYLPAFAWLFPWLGLQASHKPASLGQLPARGAALILACIILFANGLYNNLYFQNPADKPVTYDPGIDVRTVEHLQGAVDFITENELEVGYAYFWDASVVAEISGGRVAMIPIAYDTVYNMLVYHDSLTNLHYRDEDFVDGKSVFLLATIAHSGYFSATELAQYATLAYEDDFYRVYTFDFPTEAWEQIAS